MKLKFILPNIWYQDRVFVASFPTILRFSKDEYATDFELSILGFGVSYENIKARAGDPFHG